MKLQKMASDFKKGEHPSTHNEKHPAPSNPRSDSHSERNVEHVSAWSIFPNHSESVLWF